MKFHFRLCVLIFFLLLGQYLYWVGFHNFDSAQNLEHLENTFNLALCRNNVSSEIELADYNLDGSLNPTQENYVNGVLYNIVGFYVSIISLLFINLNFLSKGDAK